MVNIEPYICKRLLKKFQPHCVLRTMPKIYRHRKAESKWMKKLNQANNSADKYNYQIDLTLRQKVLLEIKEDFK